MPYLFDLTGFRQKRSLRLAVLFCCAVLLIAACTLTNPASQAPPLKLSYSLWTGYFPVIIAQEKGFFQRRGANVQLMFYEENVVENSQFVEGKTDIMLTALGNVFQFIPQNPDIRIIAALDQSNGADGVIAQSQVETIADLKPKTIGVGLGTFGELFVNQMLQQNGLTPKDVTLINVNPEYIADALEGDRIQAGHTWEPMLSQLVAKGCRVLFTSAETPGLIPDVMIAHQSVLEQRPEEVKQIIQAWFEAVEYWQTHWEEGNAIITKAFNLKPEEVSLKGVQLFNVNDSRQAFVKGNTTASLHYTGQLYVDFALQSGNISRPIDIEQFLDPSYLPET
jgi:NitT/TauT family transport system substrate-binding protein